MTTKRTFIRKFKNGNVCTVILDFDNEPKADAKWARKVENEWPEIAEEYVEWRKSIFNKYMEDLPEYQRMMVIDKTLNTL